MRKVYWLNGHRVTILAGAEETGCRYDLVEGWSEPGVQVPLHRHNRYCEQIYALEGELTLWLGDRKVVLHAGEDVFIPAGVAHTWKVTSDVPSRGLAVASPSGFARLVMEAGTPDDGSGVPPPAPTDMELLRRVSEEVGDEILGPPGTLPEEY